MFGKVLKQEREKAGLSREQLRRRILRHYETAPSVNAIRDLENGSNIGPQNRNLEKLLHVLSGLRDAMNKDREAPAIEATEGLTVGHGSLR
jgi:ribosome-binding protein aMBF1 (putative translation factor)